MQACLKESRWDEPWIDDKIKELVHGSLLDLVRFNVQVDQAIKEVKAKANGLLSFKERWIGSRPKVRAFALSLQ
jgi:DNA replication ATP-dependent helicase Dna2